MASIMHSLTMVNITMLSLIILSLTMLHLVTLRLATLIRQLPTEHHTEAHMAARLLTDQHLTDQLHLEEVLVQSHSEEAQAHFEAVQRVVQDSEEDPSVLAADLEDHTEETNGQ